MNSVRNNFERYLILLVLVMLIIVFPQKIVAKHIIGGVIYYEYLSSPSSGVNRYKLIMKMYRDCKPENNKAEFDGIEPNSPALFSIYNGSALYLKSVDFGTPIVSHIGADITNKCLILPPDICVDEGVYTTIIDLPISQESYIITYQRCCRNNTIANIVNPGDVGATFYIEITPKAQQLKNSSPQFERFPPIAICANFPLYFEHNGIDKDGDSLVYEMCAPLQGGGNILDSPGIFSCDGATPNPDCPPPYNDVVFRSPYNDNNPIGGNPPVQINRLTGLLSGTPNVLGQFVVGICMYEYRNGQLLSIVRRDFQFNLENCQKSVNASAEINGIISDNFDIKLCGDNILNIKNQSTKTESIFTYNWEFHHLSNTISGTQRDFSMPLELGNYNGKLILNKGLPCSDSMLFNIQVFPDIRADFSSIYDTCFGKNIQLNNLSVSDAGPIINSKWYANNQNFENTFDAVFNTLIPDYYDMKLKVTDQNGCQDSISRIVPFFPLPKDEINMPAFASGCQPFVHQFEKLKDYLTNEYQIIWDFGDGNTGIGLTPTHIYEKYGDFNIQVKIINPFGCEISEKFDNIIHVDRSPIAGFSYEPQKLSNFQKSTQLIDESDYSIIWYYDIAGLKTFNIAEPQFTFPDTGIYKITQIVTAENGCMDTLLRLIDVAPKYTFFLPNAFTPGIDGINDTYKPAGIPFGISNYQMEIYDRWGNKVFQSSQIDEGWNGKDSTGRNMLPGAYAVKISFIAPRGKLIKMVGTAILVQ